MTGRVVSNPGNQPIAGAEMTFERLGGTPVNARADADGNFTLSGDGSAVPSHKISLSVGGFLDRETYFLGGPTRANLVIDLIELRSPFSLDFYRQVARGLTHDVR